MQLADIYEAAVSMVFPIDFPFLKTVCHGTPSEGNNRSVQIIDYSFPP
jgi:hypothetical protein